jgi:type II secretory ATPase GspE/PulE/Tfp pilus assembly ATPase PilB-like protein
MSDLDISEKRKAQDGKIAFGQNNKKLDLRVSTIPTSNGLEVVTVRILNSGKPMALSKIGMHAATLTVFREQIAKPYGLILVCGPTGSGKTTTLHSVLRELNTPERKIWTAEDPVEVVQRNVSQVQVLPKIGWTFAQALRSFLRADPDVIMIGEIRDSETAKVAVEASMTGHLVMSTLHTNSASETLARLIDLEVPPFNLADAALAVLAQRLARRICRDCGEVYEFSDDELDTLVTEYFLASTGKAGAKAERDRLLARWRSEFAHEGGLRGIRAVGCGACNGSGYRGRLGVHELLAVTPDIRKLVRASASTGEIFKQAINDGMKTLRQDGIEKVVQGLTDLKEIRTVCL